MAKNYHPRKLESEISKLFKAFQVISITGPRQSGKSTLIKHWISGQKNKWVYVTLDDREALAKIKEDPAFFVKSIKSNIAIDEAQKAPDLFHSIKQVVDEGIPYKIILSGSANFLLLKNITESLAGRVGILQLLPFSVAEAYRKEPNGLVNKLIHSNNIDKFYDISSKFKQISDDDLIQFIFKGGYPKIYEEKKIEINHIFSSYITTYIERDLRDLTQIENLASFQKVYTLLAYQTGNIFNMSNIANDVGIDVKTVKHYMSILEASYQCKRVSPYLFCPRKRLIKSPKIFFYDTGLVNYFHGNDNTAMMQNRGSWGSIVETHVFSELYKEIKDIAKHININFWRTGNGSEIDFVIEHAQKLYPIEVKSGIHVDSQNLKWIDGFIEAYGKDKVPFGIVLYRGGSVNFLKRNILGIPINALF